MAKQISKKIEIAKIKIWDQFVGAVAWDSRGFANFEYDSTFLKKGIQLSPIMMPNRENFIYQFSNLNKETFKGLPGLLADSLPDAYGNKIINAWLAQMGRSKEDFSPIERLCYMGKRGMGALEFEPVLAKNSLNNSHRIEIDKLVDLANQILSERKKLNVAFSKNDKSNKNAIEEIISVSSSAGGARPKAIIAYNGKTKEILSGQVEAPKGFDYWLLKFDGVSKKSLGLHDPLGFGKIEYAYYLMAEMSGIKISESKLFTENNRSHFMTKRFDRENGRKIHMQTLCGLAHFDYNQAGAYSYEQAFQVIRKLNLSHEDTIQLFKRMIFNVLSRNQDDHTKNISFLMAEDGKWNLSPAYDITYSFDSSNIWLSTHQMSINGKRDNLKISDFEKIAKDENIKSWKSIFEEVLSGVLLWENFAKDLEIEKDKITIIKKIHRLNLN
jgi:serine/threonine-protein kinase HipA